MNRTRFPLILILGGLLTAGARADKVDDYLLKLIADRGIPGLQIGIYNDGKAVKTKGYGSTGIEKGRPVDEKTLFNIGSVTKQFTSAAVLLLAQAGKVTVEDSVRKHLPELPEAFEGIRIRHVLSHTSGLGDYGSVPGFDFHGQMSEADFLAALGKTKLAGAPGEKYAYSNIGYCLLGVLIHRVSGSPYEDFVAERIFKKLGMEATRFIQPGPWPEAAAVGYGLLNGEKKPGRIERAKLAAPSGAILTHALDMAKWDAALREETILKNASKAAMWSPTPLNDGKVSNYGFGWSLLKTARGTFVTHTGATAAGFRAAIVRQLDVPYSAYVSVNLATDVNLTNVLNACVKLWMSENGMGF